MGVRSYSHLMVVDGPLIDIRKEDPKIITDDMTSTPILTSNI